MEGRHPPISQLVARKATKRNYSNTLAAAAGHADKEQMKGNELKGEPQDIGAVTTDGDKWTESTNHYAGFSSLEPTLILRSQRVRASMTTCTIHEHLNEAGKRDNPSVKRADCSLSRFDLDPAEYPPLMVR